MQLWESIIKMKLYKFLSKIKLKIKRIQSKAMRNEQ